MPIYIALLRGINVGGRNSIKTDDLKSIFENLNCKNILTYIQSGNIVFEMKSKNSIALQKKLSNTIQFQFGITVPVLIFALADFKKYITNNPFTNYLKTNPEFLHITFLNESPKTEDVLQVTKIKSDADEIKILESAVYLYCPNGYSHSKFTNAAIEKSLKTQATTRNWKSCLAILDLSTKIKEL
jgi:uncharacterized protein (DUF1697 family)